MVNVSSELLQLEQYNQKLLSKIESLKVSDPEVYWFIVSWMNTNYRTPDWSDYEASNEWRIKTKKRGIDCSGFARVMQSELFNKKIRGGSQGILDTYCKRIDKNDLQMGDLLFFKAHGSTSRRINHVGIYLRDNIFVHATSPRSAAKGLGLNINSLNELFWIKDFVTAGRITKNNH